MAYINLRKLAFEAFDNIKAKEFNEAEKKLNYLLNIDHQNPILFYYLGCLYNEKQMLAMAVMAFDRAISLQNNFDVALNNAGAVYRSLGNNLKAREYFLKASDIAKGSNYAASCDNDTERAKRNLADYLCNYGSTWVGSGEPQKCIDMINKGLEVWHELPNGMWNQGLAYLELGNYEKGFYGYEFGDRCMPEKDRSYHGKPMSTPMWDGTEGQTVVVYGEQGLGDEIMFASILPDMMKKANVILECHPRLMSLFRRSFPEIPIYGTRKNTVVHWLVNHKIDAKLPIGSLGKHFRKKAEDFPGTPYIKCDEKLSQKMLNKLNGLDKEKRLPKIGISWKGGIDATNKKVRCIPLDELKPLFELDAHFISLQYHNNAQHEVDVFNEQTGNFIYHWQDIVDDYDQTAALLPHLDLIISVPQSVVHLAGSMGIKTWQLCPKQALWQMGVYGKDAPWYKSVKNFWQSKSGDWSNVITSVILQLKKEGFIVNADNRELSRAEQETA